MKRRHSERREEDIPAERVHHRCARSCHASSAVPLYHMLLISPDPLNCCVCTSPASVCSAPSSSHLQVPRRPSLGHYSCFTHGCRELGELGNLCHPYPQGLSLFRLQNILELGDSLSGKHVWTDGQGWDWTAFC